MYKIKILLLTLFIVVGGCINAQTNVLDSIDCDCIDPSHPPAHAIDGYEKTYMFYSSHMGCDFGFSLDLTTSIKAAKILIKTSAYPLHVDNYYRTQKANDEFYYVNPSGFSRLQISGANFGGIAIYEITVIEIPIEDAGINYYYDASGNMKDRTLVISNKSSHKVEEKENPDQVSEENIDEWNQSDRYIGDLSLDEDKSSEKTSIKNGNADLASGFNAENVPKNLQDGKHIRLYPNPTQGSFSIAINNIEDGERIDYQLYNSNGQLVKQASILNDLTFVNIEEEAAGMYLLKLHIKNNVEQWTIIKE